VTELRTKGIWKQLTEAAKKGSRPAYVAVAFFGQGAAKRLPLSKGSQLVVNTSEHTVKTGLTCPAELKVLLDKGVRIYGIDNLHAKVFVFGTTAYVGSANVSQPSANHLVEAMISTTEPPAVKAAREFVCDLCLHELGPEELDRLQAMYHPPRFPGNHDMKEAKGNHNGKPSLRRVLLAKLTLGYPPEGSESAQEDGKKTATRRLKKPDLYVVDDFWRGGHCPYKPGDTVVQIVDEGDGRRMVSAAGNVIYTRRWPRRGPSKCTFVYIEVPKRRRMALDRLAKRLGKDAKKRLQRGGQVSKDFAERLLAVLNR
jgi:hypothetical protein